MIGGYAVLYSEKPPRRLGGFDVILYVVAYKLILIS